MNRDFTLSGGGVLFILSGGIFVMCGIAGWVEWEADLSQHMPILEKMNSTLIPRGPDAAGFWISRHVALTHRRLAVVDPAGGSQPMTRRSGNKVCTITYNGELYNTADLKDELTSRGYIFTTNSDTEVLLTSYLEWGTNCVEHLNGIFAFAIWDELNETLFLARDRMGVKPLFYTKKGDVFLFASELKCLLAHPAVEPVLDTEGLAEIFVMGPSRTPGHGVFRDIAELKPGYCLVYNRQGMHIRPYWILISQPHPHDLNSTVVNLRDLLQDTFKRQLVSDVPICTLLSGGLDSSAISAIAAREMAATGKDILRTFSVDYIDNERYFQADHFQPNSDSQWVGRVAEYIGVQHSTVMLDTPELVEALDAATVARDLPGMADVDSSLYLFCREIKRSATVALSGECADEIFGGYPWFRDPSTLWSPNFPWMNDPDGRVRLLSPELHSLLNPTQYLEEKYQEALSEVPHLRGEEPYEARMREITYFSMTRFMPTLLDRKDRMSMAFGLEIRVPYCDHRLVEYVWNIPWRMKTCNQMEKGILRQALTGILPDDVLARRKSPYPKTHNPGYLASVQRRLAEILADPSSPLAQLVNGQAVRDLLQVKPVAGGKPWFGQLMKEPQLLAYLVQVDAWMRHYRVQIRP